MQSSNQMRGVRLILFLTTATVTVFAQTAASGKYAIALPEHRGQLRWEAAGFKVIENSAKPNGHEIGLRGQNQTGDLSFLGFFFVVPEIAPATSVRCREWMMRQESKSNAAIKTAKEFELARTGGPSIAGLTYIVNPKDGSATYVARGFLAAEDLCGDLEFYGKESQVVEEAKVKDLFAPYQLDVKYVPQFRDLLLYAQVLFEKEHRPKEAAPIFEKALAMVPKDGAPFVSYEIARRVVRDQAGMAYGMSDDLAKARSLFEEGVAEDPNYPMYYYNLACADAGENKLAEARTHLQEAFAHKANLNPGETMPDPTGDDSFTPHRGNKEFWSFVEDLKAKNE